MAEPVPDDDSPWWPSRERGRAALGLPSERGTATRSPDDLPPFEIPGRDDPPPSVPAATLPGFQIPGMGGQSILDALRPIMPGATQKLTAPQAQGGQPMPQGGGRPGMPQMGGSPPQSPMAQLTKHILPQPPTPKYRDPLETLSSPLTAMALLGSLFTRQPATTALKALGGAMKAQAEGDQVRYANEYQKYTQELGKVHTETQEELAEYKMIYENRRLSLAERTARMRGVATRRGDSVMNTYLDGGGDPGSILDARGKAVAPITAAKAKAARIAEIINAGMKAGTKISHLEAEAMYKKEKEDAEEKVASGGGTGEGEGLHGEEYLATLPAGERDLLRMMGRGDAPYPNTRTKDGWRKAKMLAQYKPDLSATLFPTHLAGQRYFASGKGADQSVSLNQMMGHEQNAMMSAKALGLTGWRTANKALMAYGRETMDPEVARFLTDVHVLRDEAARVFKGTATEGEIKRAADLIDDSSNYEYVTAQLQELISLINSRMDALSHQYERSTGQPGGDLLSPHARQAKEAVEQGGSAPPVGTVEQGYRFKGGDRYDQNNWEKVQ